MMVYFTLFREKIQYPKLFLLMASVVLSYVLFRSNFFGEMAYVMNGGGYFSVFLAGLLLSYGFTAAFAIGFFVTLAPDVNIFLGALIAATGSALSDLCIFRFIRHSFMGELEKLKSTWWFQHFIHLFHTHLSERVKKYVLWMIAGFLIASPLPDEFGVSLLSGFSNINPIAFAMIAFGCNLVGVFTIFVLASA